jgi:hypothetical protein
VVERHEHVAHAVEDVHRHVHVGEREAASRRGERLSGSSGPPKKITRRSAQ